MDRRSFVERFWYPFAYYLNQPICVASRHVSVRGRLEDARCDFAVAPPNPKLVSDIDSMRGFGRPSVEKHKARVAKLLG
jgi:hypothetical protein